MYTTCANLNEFFYKKLEPLGCQEDTKAYIISILDKYKTPTFDFSREKVTLLYAEAKYSYDFIKYQNLGDWLFFAKSCFPEHLKNASEDYYVTIAKLSYYSCYSLLNKQWPLYENIADNFENLSKETGKLIYDSMYDLPIQKNSRIL